MNKKLLLGAGAVFLILIGLAFLLIPRCEEPTEMQVLMTQLQCARAIITPDLRVEACRELGREDECEFTEDDRETIMALVSKRVNKCTRDALEAQNLCTGNVKDL